MKNKLAFSLALVVAAVLIIGVVQYVPGQGVTNTGGTSRGANFRYPADSGTPWSTSGTKTDTTSVTLQAAPGAGVSVYIYMAYCVNNSAATVDAASITATTLRAVVPCSPASKWTGPSYFDPPLQIPANTAVTMEAIAGVTTNYFYAAGTLAR